MRLAEGSGYLIEVFEAYAILAAVVQDSAKSGLSTHLLEETVTLPPAEPL